MKTRYEMIYEFMVALASNSGMGLLTTIAMVLSPL